MARKKVTHEHVEEADVQPLSDNVVELQEQADELWTKYFDTVTPYSDDRKRELREEYNRIAEKINSIKGSNVVRTIGARTEFVFPDDLDEVQPGSKLEEDLDKNVADMVQQAPKPKRGKGVQVMNPGGHGSKIVPEDSKQGQEELRRREQFKQDNPDSVAANATAPVKSQKKEGGKSIIEQIIELHEQGLSNKQIVEKGFNKSTVNRQVGEYKKRKEGIQ